MKAGRSVRRLFHRASRGADVNKGITSAKAEKEID